MAILLRLILGPVAVFALWVVFNVFFVETSAPVAAVPPAPAAAPASAAASAPLRKAYGFWVEKAGAVVRIGGDVPDEASRAALLGLAKSHARPEEIVDETSLRPDAPPRFVEVSSALVAGVARLSEGRGTLTEADISLRGRSFYQHAAVAIVRDLQDIAAPDFRADATLVVEDVAGPMNVELCREESRKLLAGGSVNFEEGGERIAPAAMGLLDPLVALLRRCSQSGVGVRIGAAQGDGGENSSLSVRRVLALAAYLRAEGLAPGAILADGTAGALAADPHDTIEVLVK